MRFNNPDFLLGRKRKKDTTEQSKDCFVGQEKQDERLAAVSDIS